jgi:CheY-like chemotaxis protein
LAEDSDDDVVIFRKEMSKASIDFPLFVTRDGEETIAYLKGAGKFGNRSEFPMPNLLLLDLVMPELTGFEVLEWIREQPSLVGLTVAVLTSSETIHDIKLAKQLGAHSFLVKPLSFKDLVQLNFILPADKSLTIAPVSRATQ